MPSRPYNVTDLDPQSTFERHVFHRDQFAHYLRWSHVLKETRRMSKPSASGTARTAGSIVDFGCGRGHLLEVMYRNKFPPERYVGIDIRPQTIAKAREKFSSVKFDCTFIVDDLVHPAHDFSLLHADVVASFEVAEHVGRQNVSEFLHNFGLCGAPGATYYLSTPNFDPKVGAAANHTYDSGRIDEHGQPIGAEVHELEHFDLQQKLVDAGFTVDRKFGTFASKRDYKAQLGPCQSEVFKRLDEYYDSELVATIMAPIVPAELARNCLWVLSRADG